MHWKRFAILSAVMLLAMAAFAQNSFAGRWSQEGANSSLLITTVSGDYLAVYQGHRMSEISVSGTHIKASGSWVNEYGIATDLVLELTISDDGGVLTGTKTETIRWSDKHGRPLHHGPETEAILFTR